MPDTLPPDLIALQTAYEAAHQAVVDYVAAKTAEHGTVWPAVDDDELERLRAAREAARKELWAHPEHAATLQGGRWKDLKVAGGAPGWKGPKK